VTVPLVKVMKADSVGVKRADQRQVITGQSDQAANTLPVRGKKPYNFRP